MNRTPGHTRRNFLRATSAAGFAAASGRVTLPEQQQAASTGSVTPSDGGEHLIHFRDGGNLFIKFGLASGSPNLAMGTQQVTIGTGIPVHRHLQTDEAFYVLGGSGTFLLNDVPTPIETGATLFIPRNTWHGFVNHDHELLLLWTITPAGFEGFFRDTCSPPGAPQKHFTREQIHELASKFATEFR
jgi:quercetin dioxygenase-like cupin family protein